MKKALLFILAILFLNNVFSQDAPPEKFKYQAIIKNNKDRVLKNTMVGVEVSIYQTSLSGDLVYQETFSPTTNADGIINLEIGTGNSTNGPFSDIPWGEGTFNLEIGVDIKGGSDYVIMGSSQLLSVPYALYAKTAKYIEGVDLGYQILSLEGNVLTLTNGGDPITLPGAGSMSFYYADRDGDGYGDKWSTVYTDLKPEGFVTDNSDCNDNDAKTAGGGVEVCDGIDNDCDGEIDNVLNPPLNPLQVGVCEGSTQTCNGAGGWVEDYSYVVGYEVDETSCDGLDNDGDGEIDEGCTTDADGDGFTVGDGDCNDIDPNVYPGASEICDGVDNNCDDQIDEGFDFQTDPNNCGDCGAACPDGYTCVAGGCEPVDNDQDGYTADVDCDDTDPTVNPSVVDLPDDNFIDSNCDGIDGNASDAIFVSVAGDDSYSGDKLNPMRSINAGIQKAVSLSKNQVYISAGTYQERVIMSNEISLYGGYASDWSRNATNNVTITGIDQDGYVASLEATSINTTTFIDHINFSTSNATGTFNNQGKSNYGIIVSSSSSLIINKCNINVGNGSNGINGVNGTNGQPGLDGFNGAPGLRDDSGYVPGGANGYLIYNGITYSGGKGGNGVYESTGQNGFSSANGTPGGFGGLSGNPGQTGGNGSNGLPGQTGYYGDGGGSGYVLELWYGGNGQKGLDGTPGTGAGGGGAGGGQTGVFVINGTGNAGGGGGSGGAPGTGGEGGFAGGASVGIILNNSPIQILACSITTGNGGAGGAGGNGGVGGAGGVGGFGGNADTDEIGAGGNGGTGGHGGAGGFGGGGEGGPSIGILTKNSSVSEVGNNFIIGNAGQGGFSTGNPGSAGLSANIRNE